MIAGLQLLWLFAVHDNQYEPFKNDSLNPVAMNVCSPCQLIKKPLKMIDRIQLLCMCMLSIATNQDLLKKTAEIWLPWLCVIRNNQPGPLKMAAEIQLLWVYAIHVNQSGPLKNDNWNMVAIAVCCARQPARTLNNLTAGIHLL